MPNQYRPDIDGLRAFAVSTILLFHLGIAVLPGGFVGVDIFFVISGFLITRNILVAKEAEAFTFSDFYIRRARRLFPALFVTLVASFIAAYKLFSPVDLERFGESLLYSVLSLSNVFFWSEAGYFDSASDLKPLLHTWSLSVEEQFYLIWPLSLILLFKCKRLIPYVLGIVGILSLLLCRHLYPIDGSATFFLLPTRVFEFAIGALCVWALRYPVKSAVALEVLTALGLLLLARSVLKLDPAAPFPGYKAIAPCLGTALIIYAGTAKYTGLLLRNRLAVGLGLISYSVYLVHWPLIVFYKYWKFTPITIFEKFCLGALTILLGWLMWKYIETPFRKRKPQSDPIKYVAPALASLLVAAGVGAWLSKGIPERYPAEFFMTPEQIIAERARYWEDSEKPNSAVLNGSSSKRLLVLGNSHAVDLMYALRQNGSQAQYILLNSGHACFNFGTPTISEVAADCRKRKAANLSRSEWNQVDTVYLHDNWLKLDLADLHATLKQIRSLTDAQIVVFGPKMVYTKSPAEIAHAHMQLASLNQFSADFQDKESRTKINNALKAFFEEPKIQAMGIKYVDMLQTQCGPALDQCNLISPHNSKFLYFDYSHFTAQGAAEFGEKLKRNYPELFE